MTILPKRHLFRPNSRTSSKSTTVSWMNLPSSESAPREKRPSRIKNSASKTRDSPSTKTRCKPPSKGMKRDSSRRKRKLLRPYKSAWPESNKKRMVLRPSMSKRERPSNRSRRTSSNLSRSSNERRPSKLKNTRILRDSKRSSSKTMKLRTRGFKNLTSNSIRLCLRVSWALENKSSNGRANTTKWRELMLISRVNSKKRKPFGKVNLSSLRSKRSRLRRIMRRPSNNSDKPWTNFIKLKTIARTKTTSLITLLCSKWTPSIRRSLRTWQRQTPPK